MDLRIRIDAPRGGARRLVLFAALPVALVAAASMLARAYDTAWIQPGADVDAARFKATFDEIQSRLAVLEGTGDCPPGYARGPAMNVTLCTRPLAGKAVDEMVKVGNGPSAFWVDRFEASVWKAADGGGGQYGGTGANGKEIAPDYALTFPPDGQGDPANDLYALSRAGVPPSASITWFQAQEACRASGKRLPTGEEWLDAARGTVDPGASPGPGCLTFGGGARPTGQGDQCVSSWGAEDMIGNLWEWTTEWHTGVAPQEGVWPDAAYRGDGTWNVTAVVSDSLGNLSAGIPGAGLRGGDWADGPFAGVFALSLLGAPSHTSPDSGFRCVIAR